MWGSEERRGGRGEDDGWKWSEMTVGRYVNSEKGISETKEMEAEHFGGGILGVFILAPQFQAATCHFNTSPMSMPHRDKCGIRLLFTAATRLAVGRGGS